jgi:hypothetical protein
MAKHDLVNACEREESKNESKKDYVDVEMLQSSFSPGKKKNKHKSDRSFTEMVQESTRLPEIKSSRLPISMKEILHSSPKSSEWTPRLPSLPQGQVQLVHRNETKSNRKEKRRLKRERKSKVQGQRKHESSLSHCIDEHNEVSWKKKLHQRQKKRILDDGESSLTMTREFRLPTLREVSKW